MNREQKILVAFTLSLLAGLILLALNGCSRAPEYDDEHDHEIPEHTHPTDPAPVVTVDGLVNHDVFLKHDSRSVPDHYKVFVNGLLVADTTIASKGNGDLVPWVKFSTYQGDVLRFETTGSNQAIVDITELQFIVVVK